MHNNSNSKGTLNTALQLAGSISSGLFDSIADAFQGKADSLRDGSEFDPVDLPRDLFAHARAQTEWWYYTGHVTTDSRRNFGFELVFFKRRTDLDRFGLVPLRLLGNPIYFAHFALTDIDKKQFQYSHRKSSNRLFDFPAAASESHYFLRLGDWSIREVRGKHLLTASMNSHVNLDVRLRPKKAPILNGRRNDGVSFKDKAEASRYFSFSRMEVEGELAIEGKSEQIRGSAWMDREFGTWTATEKQKGWDWFSIQMDNNTELMIYQLRDGSNRVSEYSSGVFVTNKGLQTYLRQENFRVTPLGYWRSPRSRAAYPVCWRIEVPLLDISFEVTPVMEDQELDTRGTTMIIYWEGACRVSGEYRGSIVGGHAYVELVGYDRSHESPNLAHFLLGNHFESV